MSSGHTHTAESDSQWTHAEAVPDQQKAVATPEWVADIGESLAQRVEETIGSHRRRELLSTTGTVATVEELVIRNAGLEKAIRALASELEALSDRFDGRIERLVKAPPPTTYTIGYPFPDDEATGLTPQRD
ncbi:hypothetical protein [Gaiella sp.]|uniref:hypothetical protein n=1 Tax=Gaiella sp. TaxID=2663207 RepID=UPI0032635086